LEDVVLVEDVSDDEDALAFGSLRRPHLVAGPNIYPVRPSVPSPSSSLSPHASPFYPGDDPVGRSKARRWADEDSDGSEAVVTPVSSTTSYLNTVLRGSLI
jgi:hypothetical protein